MVDEEDKKEDLFKAADNTPVGDVLTINLPGSTPADGSAFTSTDTGVVNAVVNW
ncbi:MAG: hypothetical protein IH936_11415 [Acidobacteria bacterium]|nr:hypothetical protein [Acidobacteriota bacterium]